MMALRLHYVGSMKLLIVALLLVGCTPATLKKGLHYAAVATEWTAQGSMVCDAGSTHAAMGDTRFYETNPVMGEHPSNGTQVAYWSGWAVGIAAYNRLLPDTLRVLANSVVIGVEVDAVVSNTSLGVKACGI